MATQIFAGGASTRTAASAPVVVTRPALSFQARSNALRGKWAALRSSNAVGGQGAGRPNGGRRLQLQVASAGNFSPGSFSAIGGDARIKVIGVGGGGGNAVNRMIQSGLQVHAPEGAGRDLIPRLGGVSSLAGYRSRPRLTSHERRRFMTWHALARLARGGARLRQT